jgi:hypothetical protein
MLKKQKKIKRKDDTYLRDGSEDEDETMVETDFKKGNNSKR